MKKIKSVKNAPSLSKSPGRYWPWIALLVVLLCTSAIRGRLLHAPLERDEGEYAYAAQLLLQGAAPYAQVYSMKMPGIYAAYAVILALFGQTHAAIHLGLLIINALTVVLMFLLARRLFDPLTGVAAAAALALLSLGQHVHGVSANAEHFVLPLALGGILLLLRALDKEKLWPLLGAAALLGMSFLMKQHGAAFIIFAVCYLIYHQWRRRCFQWKSSLVKIILFIIVLLLPFLITCSLLAAAGALDKFWFWTFSYARQYAAGQSLSKGYEIFVIRISRIVQQALLLWLLAGLGLISLWFNKTFRRRSGFVLGFLFFSFIAICPGFYFRPHYFIFLLPAVSLLAGIGAAGVAGLFAPYKSVLMSKVVPVLLALAVLFQACYQQRDFFFLLSPLEVILTTYRGNPFAESLEIARYLREHTSENDRLAVVGSEPQIYFYTQCRSATRYIYTYEMVRNHSYARTMQQEMIQEIEAARPKFLILVNITLSWMAKEGTDETIMKWFEEYPRENYQRVGVVDVFLYPKKSQYYWDQDAAGYTHQSPAWIEVYQRTS